MKLNKENYKKFIEDWVSYQFELIDAIDEKIKKLNINDKKEYAIYTLLEGNIFSLFFRLKGINNFIKEVLSEEITIPTKYENYIKKAQDMFFLDKEKNLKTYIVGENKQQEEIDIDFIITALKSEKNGQQTNNKKK